MRNMEEPIVLESQQNHNKVLLFLRKNVFPYLTRSLFLSILFGQILSLLLCTAGTVTQKLVIDHHVDVPAFQAFLNYCLLTLVVSTKFFYNGEKAIETFKKHWWIVIIAFIDVAGNYFVYRAYQYTSLTSVQLLDCLSIPVVVTLSILCLKARYKLMHYIGILICLTGLGLLVWADLTGSRHQGPKSGSYKYEVIGDVMVIGGAIMYGISNVAEEFVVKTSTDGITEFVGILGFSSCFFSAINVYFVERHALSNINWDFEVVLYLSLNTLSMFSFYILMPWLIARGSATLVNLTLLTADLYSLFVGLYIFDYTFSHLYILSFFVVVAGVIIFKIFPTPSRVDNVLGVNVVNDDEEEILEESSE